MKRIHFADVKPLRQFLMFSSKFLFKRFQKWAQRRGPSLFNQRKSKYLLQFDSQGLPEDYQADTGFLAKLQKAGTFAEKNIPDKAVSNCKSKKGFLDCVSFWHKKGFSQWSKVSPKTAL